jgi:hypothetical protein
MTTEQLTTQLTKEGLRLADETESGWAYSYISDEGQRVTVWVTEI